MYRIEDLTVAMVKAKEKTDEKRKKEQAREQELINQLYESLLGTLISNVKWYGTSLDNHILGISKGKGYFGSECRSIVSLYAKSSLLSSKIIILRAWTVPFETIESIDELYALLKVIFMRCATKSNTAPSLNPHPVFKDKLIVKF